ncbi:tRNA (guanine-N(7)-)-methyltransferase [Cryptomeria japonica]|uniref:tRNA (guanine-N(7)-)-methyltransferase n=1 Tax=Cryptomeria japonica TaxID=3369 RepID=UPI0025AD6353|nr:tRNA (guanine-N(7)-)-methyltransferase [Cryptomeria japonica]
MSHVGEHGASVKHPRKRFYRARAHSNPLSDSHFPVPLGPAQFDYADHFPAYFSKKNHQDNESPAPNPNGEAKEAQKVSDFKDLTPANACSASTGEEMKIRFADIGCGFGGLLVQLSPIFPSTLMIGMELRDKVSEYVKERILALRKANPGHYENISVVRTNSMKFLPNYFDKGQLQKMFFLFPDPHFKEKNHRRRVITVPLLAEYAYAMAVGGILYTITDVEELGEWMKGCLDAHPLFEEVGQEELKIDPVVKLLTTATEEGQKVARNEGQTFQAIYRRIAPPLEGA